MSGAGTGILGMNPAWSQYLEKIGDAVVFNSSQAVALPLFPWQLQAELNASCLPSNTTIYD